MAAEAERVSFSVIAPGLRNGCVGVPWHVASVHQPWGNADVDGCDRRCGVLANALEEARAAGLSAALLLIDSGAGGASTGSEGMKMVPVHRNRALLVAYLVFLGLVVASGLLTNAVQRALDAGFGTGYHALLYLLIAIVLAVPLFVIFRYGLNHADRILGSVARMSFSDQEKPRRYLLMGYSPMEEKAVKQALADAAEMPIEKLAAPSAEYEKYLVENKLTLWPNLWQQNARAAYFHKKTLERILVLNPGKDQFDDFKEFIKYCLNNDVLKLRIDLITLEGVAPQPFKLINRRGQYEAPSYEDYDYVYEGLRRGLEMLQEDSGREDFEHDVCIDATPGFKPFSIAAAILTLNRKLKFSYVTSRTKTGGGEVSGGEVRFYDANIMIAAS